MDNRQRSSPKPPTRGFPCSYFSPTSSRSSTRDRSQNASTTVPASDLRSQPPEHVLERLPADQQDRLVALADTTTLTHDELPILVIDRSEEPPQHLRVTADQLWSIDNNLTLGNMDYEEFTEAAHDDGVFRGF
ncbi:DUF6924 domain-containing protein [Streptomyces sp. NPDC058746]|uniref:DUF6924 domain-containing protein n=1 Tax=Streptomyces sp. NPDC058746 TaxID=3346622 RepID=UPI0036A97BAC